MKIIKKWREFGILMGTREGSLPTAALASWVNLQGLMERPGAGATCRETAAKMPENTELVSEEVGISNPETKPRWQHSLDPNKEGYPERKDLYSPPAK